MERDAPLGSVLAVETTFLRVSIGRAAMEFWPLSLPPLPPSFSASEQLRKKEKRYIQARIGERGRGQTRTYCGVAVSY